MNHMVYRTVNDKQIAGKTFYAIVKNGHYFFSNLIVYADGLIWCWELMDLSTLKEKLQSGWIRINLPKDGELHIGGLGRISYHELIPEKTNEDFIKEIEDAITELNGGEDRISLCINAFKNYLLNDSEENFLKLERLFADLPSNKKVLFEYVDYKDPLVELMSSNIKFTNNQRKFMLNDYFEDEWNKNEFIESLNMLNCQFNTQRLEVHSWKNQINEHYSKEDFAKDLMRILSLNVTKDLPPGWQNLKTINQALQWINDRDGESHFLTISNKSTKELIGFIFLYETTTEGQSTNIDLRFGYLLAETSWGQGMGTEVVKGLLQWGKAVGTIQSLAGGVARTNIGSIKVLEKIGFTTSALDADTAEVLFYEYRFH